MNRHWAIAAILCAGALLAAAELHFPLGISRAAAAGQGSAPVEIACGSLVDATGGKVSDQAGGEQVATSTSRRCPAPAGKPAPRVADAARPALNEAVPGLSAQSAPRPASPQEDPLRFAAENPERVGAALLTGGAMIWALHSSFWSWLLVLGLPLWRHVDVLPIVAATEDETQTRPAAPSPEEAAVAQILEARSTPNGTDSHPS